MGDSVTGGKRGERGERKKKGGRSARVMECTVAAVQMMGGLQSSEQVSRRDFPLSEYMNMFQCVHVLEYHSLLFWAVSTRSSRVLTLLTLLSHLAMEGGLGSFQHEATQALAALVKCRRIDFLYVQIGIFEQWSRKKVGSLRIGKSVNCWEILCTSDQYYWSLKQNQKI